MKSKFPKHVFLGFAFILTIALFWTTKSVVAENALQDLKQKTHSSSDKKETTADSKAEILEALHQRLKSAPDPDSAVKVAAAIEALWLQSGSDTVDLLMRRSSYALEKKNFGLALELLDAIVSIKPDYSEGWNRRASVYFVQQNYQKALIDLRKALALNEKNYKAIRGLALTLRETGYDAQALEVFKKLNEIHPHLPDVKKALTELTREIEGQDS